MGRAGLLAEDCSSSRPSAGPHWTTAFRQVMYLFQLLNYSAVLRGPMVPGRNVPHMCQSSPGSPVLGKTLNELIHMFILSLDHSGIPNAPQRSK